MHPHRCQFLGLRKSVGGEWGQGLALRGALGGRQLLSSIIAALSTSLLAE